MNNDIPNLDGIVILMNYSCSLHIIEEVVQTVEVDIGNIISF